MKIPVNGIHSSIPVYLCSYKSGIPISFQVVIKLNIETMYAVTASVGWDSFALVDKLIYEKEILNTNLPLACGSGFWVFWGFFFKPKPEDLTGYRKQSFPIEGAFAFLNPRVNFGQSVRTTPIFAS